MGTLKKNYTAPLLTELGAFSQLTAGDPGSTNDGQGGGQGGTMAPMAPNN